MGLPCGRPSAALLACVLTVSGLAPAATREPGSSEEGSAEDGVDREVAMRKVLDRRGAAEDRTAALHSLMASIAGPLDWLQLEELCRKLLRSPETPEELLLPCGDGLARALRARMPMRDVAAELERFAGKVPRKAKGAVAEVVDVLRKPYDGDLGSGLADRLSRPIEVRDVASASARSELPGPVEIGSVKMAGTASGPLPVPTGVWGSGSAGALAKRLPGPVTVQDQGSAGQAARERLPAAVALPDEGSGRNVAARLPSPVKAHGTVTGKEAMLRLRGPIKGEGLSRKGAGKLAAWVDRTLSANLLEEARKLEEQGKLEEARECYARFISLLPTVEESAGGLQGLLRTFRAGPGGDDLLQGTERLREWVREHIQTRAIIELAELFVGRALYREGAYEEALAAVALFRERYPGSHLLPHADLLESLVYIRTDKKAMALPVLERASKRAEADAEVAQKALFLMGWIHLFEQDYARARPALEAVVRGYPEGKYAEKAKELLKGLPAAETPR